MSRFVDLDSLHKRQLVQWELARLNYSALQGVEVRCVDCNGVSIDVQHNPQRITSVSSTAATQKPVETRCFLCQEQLPVEQIRLAYDANYHILVNPYPIFDRHFTIPDANHTPQRIMGRVATMLDLAQSCAPYTIFYNGPRCGASAPMHMHFQVAQAGCIPIEKQWRNAERDMIVQRECATLSLLKNMLRPIFVIIAIERHDAEVLFDTLYAAMPPIADEEPMLNIIARYEDERWVLLIFPRAKHRPDCYYADNSTKRLISPGTVEMGGLFITPRQEDYVDLTAQEIEAIYNEVCPSTHDIQQIILNIKANI